MKRWQTWLGSAGVIGVVVIVAGLAFNTSLWLMWHLLPSDFPVRAAVRISAGSASLRALAATHLPGELTAIQDQIHQLALAQRHEKIVLVVLPRWQSQTSLAGRLQAAGWQVDRHGLLLRATRPREAGPAFAPAARLTAKTLLHSRWPVTPLAIVDVAAGMIPHVNESLQLVVVNNQQTIRALLLMNHEPITTEPVTLVRAPATGPTTLTFPGSLLATLPRPQQEVLQERLQAGLGFLQTRPPILEELTTYPAVTITITYAPDGSLQPTLAVESQSSRFVQAVTAWVQEEERRSRLTTRAFRLPDGTLGHEKVPGEAVPVFRPAGNCLQPVSGRTSLWLCRQEGGASVGANQAAVQSAALPRSDIAVAVSATTVSRLTTALDCSESNQSVINYFWCQVDSLQVAGRPARLVVELEGRY